MRYLRADKLRRWEQASPAPGCESKTTSKEQPATTISFRTSTTPIPAGRVRAAKSIKSPRGLGASTARIAEGSEPRSHKSAHVLHIDNANPRRESGPIPAESRARGPIKSQTPCVCASTTQIHPEGAVLAGWTWPQRPASKDSVSGLSQDASHELSRSSFLAQDFLQWRELSHANCCACSLIALRALALLAAPEKPPCRPKRS